MKAMVLQFMLEVACEQALLGVGGGGGGAKMKELAPCLRNFHFCVEKVDAKC